jgi:Do/DeqQ family serine protease
MQFIKIAAAILMVILTSASVQAEANLFGDSSEDAPALIKKIPQSNEDIQLSFAPLVKRVSPAVVNIYSTRKIKVKNVSPFMNDPMFRHFFGNSFGTGVSERQESSLGSGVIVKEDGLIITSNHVIDKSDTIRVVLSDRREFEAKVILADEKTDLALLRINAKNLAYLELMDSDTLEVGDIVLAIGDPFGVGQTVTQGIVSATARTTIGISDYQFFIQTDAAINPGNSGGALVTSSGKLAGINTAIYTQSGGSNGIGFAIPANMVATVINNGAGGEHIVRPWLGVTTVAVSQDVANSLGLEKPSGALVSALYEGGPLQEVGIKVGDIITMVDNTHIVDNHELNFRVATYKVGTVAKFTVLRAGKSFIYTVKMIAPVESPKRDVRAIRGQSPLTGASVMNLSPAVADQFGLPLDDIQPGVIVSDVAEGTAAQRVGFQKKDIIAQVNGENVTSTQQLVTMLAKKAASVKVTIKRGQRAINIILNGDF